MTPAENAAPEAIAPEATVPETAAPEAAAADAQKAVAGQMEKTAKSLEDVAAFGQESLDAFVKAGGIAMKTAEEINAEMVSFSKRSVEEGVAAAKEMAASKSVLELFEKQTGYARTAVDGIFKQMARVNDLTLAASREAMEPIAARAVAAAELVKPRAA